MIEVFNSRVTLQRHNHEAAEFAARYELPGIACSDSHSALRDRHELQRAAGLRDGRRAAQAPLPDERVAWQPLHGLHPPHHPLGGLEATCSATGWARNRHRRRSSGPRRREKVGRGTRSSGRPPRSCPTPRIQRPRVTGDSDPPRQSPTTTPSTAPSIRRPPSRSLLYDPASSSTRRPTRRSPTRRSAFGDGCSTGAPSARSSSAWCWSSSCSASSSTSTSSGDLELVRSREPGFLLAAFVAYYLTFPLRGLRWGTPAERRHVASATATRPRSCSCPGSSTAWCRPSWATSIAPTCCAPTTAASISRTVGTIFIERIADLVVIFALALAAGFWSFRGRNRARRSTRSSSPASWWRSALIIFVVVLRFFGRHLTRFLPDRFGELYERFHEGSTGALTPEAFCCRSAPSRRRSGCWREPASLLRHPRAGPAGGRARASARPIFVALAARPADRDPADAGRDRLRRGRHRRRAGALRRAG